MKRNTKATHRISTNKRNGQRVIFGCAGMLMMLCVLLMWPLNASAGDGRKMAGQDRFVLDYGDNHYLGHRGDSATLYLKRALKNQYPWVNVSDYRLRRVVLVAKTKHGRGSAQLRVGPELTDYYRVGGHPSAFHRNHPRTFDRVRIGNPFRDSWGPWQLQLNGNFKVRKVVLIVEERGRHHRDLSTYDRHDNWSERWSYGDGHFYFNMRW